ncbi:CLOCK-interacting pacemaker-like [Hippoglossus hippoglossus]|uniref:CLOCK-interacting pacemaker-like n=1 Tax=Hippoglossus hippoglossus TaxID=8267 RepID=UPI00148C13CA|nr:CLOCK-interacting pacemaker-like [Hippoglossus hippoglossus]
MPKEQGHCVERPVRSTSKNAKDKSNSATLRASKSGYYMEPPGMGDMIDHLLRCDSERDSEKDSGYSDSVHTDVDDQRSSVSEPYRQSSKSSNNNHVNGAVHNMPPYEELPPIYVIKNLIVKPSRPEPFLHGPLALGGGWHSLTSTQAPTQLLLIQQPAMPASSTSTPSFSQAAPQAQIKTGGSRHNQNHGSKNSYLPILNSYARIAPHPRKESHKGKGRKWVEGLEEAGGEGQSQSKRVCTEDEKREAVSTTHHLLKPQQQRQKEGRFHSYFQYKDRGGHNPFPILSQSPPLSHPHHFKQSLGSPSISSCQTPSPPSFSESPSFSSAPSSSPSSSTAHSPYRLPPDSSFTCQHRFLDTAESLNQLGLLAITLRTKELLKQNAATEREIAQLRQHTHLLCQVAKAGHSRCSNGSGSLNKLLQALSKSPSYPNLDFNQLKTLSSSRQQGKARTQEDREKDNIKTTKTHSNPLQEVSLHKLDDGTSPPSPLFAPSPDTEETQHADDPLNLMSTSLTFPRSIPEQRHRQTVMD